MRIGGGGSKSSESTDGGTSARVLGTFLSWMQEKTAPAFVEATASPALGPFIDVARAIALAKPVPAAVPLDIRGTAFQWRVWRALTRIPVGETRAYSRVAASIGRPEATRAVARACATNPISLVVPCHRVVGRDGSVTGYRWGTDVKTALLAKEGRRRR